MQPHRTAAVAAKPRRLDHLPGATLACFVLALGYYAYLWVYSPAMAIEETGQIVQMRHGLEAFFVTTAQAFVSNGLFMLLMVLIVGLSIRVHRTGKF
jgi:hypothetical protein